MEKIFNVEGIMCPRCEMRVKTALEKLDGVHSAAACHQDGKVTIVCEDAVTDASIIAAITDAGYKVRL